MTINASEMLPKTQAAKAQRVPSRKLANPQCKGQQVHHDQHGNCCDLHISMSETGHTQNQGYDCSTQHGCDQKNTDK